MNDYIILADITCDVSSEIQEHFGIKDYVRGHIHFSDGRDFATTLDWSNVSREDFYKALSSKSMKITTAPASPEEYYECFRKYASEGYDVLSMSISSKISSTYDVAKKAAERVKAEFPEREIYCLDSMRMSGSFGLLTVCAHEMKNDGKSMQEVIAWLEENKHKVHQMGPIDDLMFIARRGRISTGKAIMGSFAGVKPMGDCNSDGYVTVLTKVKGIKKALATTVSYIRHAATDIENNYIYITHSNREAYATELKEMIENELHPKKVFLCDVFSGSGTNIGPGMVCASFIGDAISEDGSKEKELMNKATESC